MTRRGGHWARYRVSVGIETAGFRPAESPFRRVERKTCRPRAISVTHCGSSSSSFWASRAVSVPMMCQRVRRCSTKKKNGSIFPPGGNAVASSASTEPADSIGVTTLPDVVWYPSRLWINIPHHHPSTTTRCRRVNCARRAARL